MNTQSIQDQLKLAKVAAKKGDFSSANSIYNQTLLQDQHHVEATYSKAVILLNQGLVKQALIHMNDVLRYQGCQQEYWANYIDLLLTHEDYDSARQAFISSQSSELTESDYQTLVRRFSNIFESKEEHRRYLKIRNIKPSTLVHYDESISLLEEWLLKYPNDGKALISLAQLYILFGDLEKSKNTINIIISLEPLNLATHLTHVRFLLKTNRLDNAKILITNCYDFYPKNKEVCFLLGTYHAMARNFNEAIKLFDESLALDSCYRDALLGNAMANASIKRFDEAVSLARSAIKVNPEIVKSWLTLASILEISNQINNAKDTYKRVIKLDKSNEIAYLKLAAIQYHNQEFKESIKNYESVLKINPENSEAYSKKGLAFFCLQKYTEAFQDQKKALSLCPNSAEIRLNLARTLIGLGHLTESLKELKLSLKLNSNQPDALNTCGIIYQKMGNIEQARHHFKLAINLAPKKQESYVNLGVTFQDENDLEKATFFYKQSLPCNERNSRVYYQLASIDYERGDILSAVRHLQLSKKIEPQSKVIDASFRIVSSKSKSNLPKESLGRVENNLVPILLTKEVDSALTRELYNLPPRLLNNTHKDDARFGNGICSADFNFIQTDSPAVFEFSQDLVKILERYFSRQIYIYSSFFNIFQKGGGSRRHWHLSDHDKYFGLERRKFSLVYYLKVGDQSGDEPGILRLYEPDIDIIPTKGMIVIIPANRFHSSTYDGMTDRVMIGVNFYIL